MIILNLRVEMAKKKLNMQQLSDLTGIRRATISAYFNETYKMIGKDHLDILCRVLQCTPADLIEYKPDEYEDQDFTELANAYKEYGYEAEDINK